MTPPLSGSAIFQRLPVPTPVAAIRPVEVPVHVMAIEALRAKAVVHAHRLEPIPEAARLGRLNEGHTGDRHSRQRSKNKPHDLTSRAVTPHRTPQEGQKISYDPKV